MAKSKVKKPAASKSVPAIPSKVEAVQPPAVAINAKLEKKLAEAEHRLALVRKEDTEALAAAHKEIADLKASAATAAEEKAAGAIDINTAAALLMELPESSNIRKSVQGFLDALVADKKNGGAVGGAALAILDAACDSTDPAYATVSVAQRAMAVTMANALKAAFV